MTAQSVDRQRSQLTDSIPGFTCRRSKECPLTIVRICAKLDFLAGLIVGTGLERLHVEGVKNLTAPASIELDNFLAVDGNKNTRMDQVD